MNRTIYYKRKGQQQLDTSLLHVENKIADESKNFNCLMVQQMRSEMTKNWHFSQIE